MAPEAFTAFNWWFFFCLVFFFFFFFFPYRFGSKNYKQTPPLSPVLLAFRCVSSGIKRGNGKLTVLPLPSPRGTAMTHPSPPNSPLFPTPYRPTTFLKLPYPPSKLMTLPQLYVAAVPIVDRILSEKPIPKVGGFAGGIVAEELDRQTS